MNTFTIVDNIVDGNMKFTKVEASQIVINDSMAITITLF